MPDTESALLRRLWLLLLAMAAIYVLLAYLAAPFAWRHFEHQAGLANVAAWTTTAGGIPGDPLNVGLEGSETDVVCAMQAAGWSPADPVTLASALRIAGDVVFHRPYLSAPVSALYFKGRKQDLAFEKESGKSPSARNHVRFWKALDEGHDGRPVWLGAATFDTGVRLSRYTGQITHRIAPDIDAERDAFWKDLSAAKKVEETYWVSGVGPTLFARNGGGDPYFTDGEIAIAKLASGCEAENPNNPTELAIPPANAAKNVVFRWLAGLRRLSL